MAKPVHAGQRGTSMSDSPRHSCTALSPARGFTGRQRRVPPVIVAPDGTIDLSGLIGRLGSHEDPVIENLPAGTTVVGLRSQPAERGPLQCCVEALLGPAQRFVAREGLRIIVDLLFHIASRFNVALGRTSIGLKASEPRQHSGARYVQHHCRPTPMMIDSFARMLPQARPRAGHLQPKHPIATSASLPSRRRCKGPKSLPPLPPAARQDPDIGPAAPNT